MALLIIPLLIAVLYDQGRIPLLSKNSNLQEQIKIQEKLYLRSLEVISQKKEVNKIFKRNKQSIENMENNLFHGKNANIMASRLQKLIQELAHKYHVSIKRTNTLKPEDVGEGLTSISIRFYGTSKSMTDLNQFLYSIEYNKDKLLFIPGIYLKKIRQSLQLEMEVFSLGLTK